MTFLPVTARSIHRARASRAWRDCGVRYMVVINASIMQRSLRKGLASVPLFNKIVRGLKKL